MKTILKSVTKRVIGALVVAVQGTSIGRFVYAQIVVNAMSRIEKVTYSGVKLMFAAPNAQASWRVETFASKEPETLEWIDSIPKGSIVWDIGANVGLYTCYAARARDCRVYAFEPSVFNLELLARNVVVNQLSERVTVVPLPLCEGVEESTLNMSNMDWGGALSTFGQEYGQNGLPLDKVFEYRTVGISMIQAVEWLQLPVPQYIKIDVDGIEHLILRGGATVLSQVRSVLIEVNDGFREQAVECAAALNSAGLSLVEKRHSQMVHESDFRETFNQIWTRVSTVPTVQV